MFHSAIFKKALFGVVALITGYTLLLAFFVLPKVETSIHQLEEKNAKEALSKIVTISKNVYLDLETYKKDALEQHKMQLKEVSDTLWSSTLNDPNLSQKEIINIIKKIKYGQDGYFWINDFERKMIMHPFANELDGKSLKEYKDSNGKFLFNEMVQVVSKDTKEGFVSYLWPKPDEVKPQPKISFVRAYSKYKWIIGTGVYIDDIDKEVSKRKDELKNQLKQIISETKIGKTGYLYIFDSSGLLIAHPDKKIDGTSIKDFINPSTKRHLLEDLKSAALSDDKMLAYKWNKLEDKENFVYNKIAWIEYIPELDWYVGSSVYENDFKDSSHSVLIYVSLIACIAILIAIILSYLFLERLLDPITKLSKFATSISLGDYSLRCKIDQNDEIGILAKEFNTMATKIEDNIYNLETKIDQEVEKNKVVNEQLYKSEKMAAMGEMIGNIAHQWRQPLSVISVSATGIQLHNELRTLTDEKINNACESINKNAQYLSQTIDDFRNFIKGDRVKVHFNLKEQIDSFLQLVEGTIKNNDIRMILNIDQSIMLNSYPNELNQCLINLFNNSKDSLNENEIEDKIIFIDGFLDNDDVVINLKDNGGGIDESIIENIFEPYFTTKHKSQGTGLGLHMSYRIVVEGFDGTIEAKNSAYTYENKTMKGALLTIRFRAE